MVSYMWDAHASDNLSILLVNAPNGKTKNIMYPKTL